jgi:glycosyltransferase involved in cell wall biosynthesis
MKPLISVNITTYNRSCLLERCIKSVQKQSYEEIEINIVDDFSSDNTIDVVQRMQNHDQRINLLCHSKNKGNAHARNTALANSNGKYIAFLDDDDEWIDDEKLTKQKDILENSTDERLAIVCTSITRVQENRNNIVEINKRPNCITKASLNGGIIHNSTALVRTDIAKKSGGFDIFVKRGIDSEFFRRLIVKYKYNVYFMSDITCKYNESSPSRLSKSSYYHFISNIWNLIKYIKYYFIYPHCLIKRLKKVVISTRFILN